MIWTFCARTFSWPFFSLVIRPKWIKSFFIRIFLGYRLSFTLHKREMPSENVLFAFSIKIEIIFCSVLVRLLFFFRLPLRTGSRKHVWIIWYENFIKAVTEGSKTKKKKQREKKHISLLSINLTFIILSLCFRSIMKYMSYD